MMTGSFFQRRNAGGRGPRSGPFAVPCRCYPGPPYRLFRTAFAQDRSARSRNLCRGRSKPLPSHSPDADALPGRNRYGSTCIYPGLRSARPSSIRPYMNSHSPDADALPGRNRYGSTCVYPGLRSARPSRLSVPRSLQAFMTPLSPQKPGPDRFARSSITAPSVPPCRNRYRLHSVPARTEPLLFNAANDTIRTTVRILRHVAAPPRTPFAANEPEADITPENGLPQLAEAKTAPLLLSANYAEAAGTHGPAPFQTAVRPAPRERPAIYRICRNPYFRRIRELSRPIHETDHFIMPRAELNSFGLCRGGETDERNSTISLSRAQSRTRSSYAEARNGRKKFNGFPHLWSYTLSAKPNKNPFLRPTFASRTSPRILPKFAFALDIFISLTAF
ncbi:hypothetical protein BN3659_00201 [Alistipes sp. CHKCI003]|nr:hypothetical protein BN3659_00201 [Alistipes sp. CHKCI003]